jgi:hypothetical protein
LTAGVALNVRNAIARIRPGIPRNGIFVEHTDDLGHGSSPLAHDCGGDRRPQVSQVHGRHLCDYTPEPRLRRTSGRMIGRSRSLRSSACSERGGSQRHSSRPASCFSLVFGAGSLGNPTSTEFAGRMRLEYAYTARKPFRRSSTPSRLDTVPIERKRRLLTEHRVVATRPPDIA